MILKVTRVGHRDDLGVGRYEKPDHRGRSRTSFDHTGRGQQRALDRPDSAEPIPRPGPPASGAIGRIGKLAFVDRKASASNAFREPRPETLELSDPLIDPFRPFAGETRPVSASGNAIGWKFGELRADFVERQPDPLREHDERDSAQHRPGVAAIAGASPLRRNEAPLLVKAQGRGCDPATPRNLADGQHRIHAESESTISS
jgi:hypothetical protein